MKVLKFFIVAVVSFAAGVMVNKSCHECDQAVLPPLVSVGDSTTEDESPAGDETSGYQLPDTTTVITLSPNVASDFTGVGTVGKLDGVPEQMLQRLGYVSSYNAETRCPNWVAWHLTAGHTTGEQGRMNAFREDLDVPAPRAMQSDYKGSGFSRGHMCPAGDNKWHHQAMFETFLFTNICPQDANLNSGLWNRIEISCRRWAEKYGDIYIVTGPLFFKSNTPRFVGENRVAVPDAFFKVVLRLNPEPAAIAYVCRNTSGEGKRDQYVNSLSQAERITGMRFFPDLDPDVRNQIADVADESQW